MITLNNKDLEYIDSLIDRIDTLNNTFENDLLDETVKDLRRKLKLKKGLRRHKYTCSNCGKEWTSWQDLHGTRHEYCPDGQGYWTK